MIFTVPALSRYLVKLLLNCSSIIKWILCTFPKNNTGKLYAVRSDVPVISSHKKSLKPISPFPFSTFTNLTTTSTDASRDVTYALVTYSKIREQKP